MRISDWSSDVCSSDLSEDGEAVLRESLRCVKPGGMVIISDTPWYLREEDGRRMLAERQSAFLRRHGTAGSSIAMLGFLSDAWLQGMQRALSIQWEAHRPCYGLAWALRPAVAKLRARRPPSRFRLWVARAEEHTSELQSLMRISYAVFCLKKKTTPHTIVRKILHTQ